MVSTVLLDLDNTILDFDTAERASLTKALLELGIQPEEEILTRYHQLNQEQWKLLEQGKATRREVKQNRFSLLFQEFRLKGDVLLAAEKYETYLGSGHYFIEGAEALLAELAKKYRLYLVTNGTAHVQYDRLASAGIGNYFQGIFISEELGANKPSKEYFDICFSRIPAFCREETVIIGDSLTSDIQGGINAGIRTIWYHSAEEELHVMHIQPDYKVC